MGRTGGRQIDLCSSNTVEGPNRRSLGRLGGGWQCFHPAHYNSLSASM